MRSAARYRYRPGMDAMTSRSLRGQDTSNGEDGLTEADWTLHPPPAKLTPTWTPDIWRHELLLMNACVKHGVTFRWSLGVLYIPLRGVEVVLGELASKVRVLGFDTFRLEGYWVYPRLDYYSSYGDGIPVADALADIADWPRDMELWIEAVITDEVGK